MGEEIECPRRIHLGVKETVHALHESVSSFLQFGNHAVPFLGDLLLECCEGSVLHKGCGTGDCLGLDEVHFFYETGIGAGAVAEAPAGHGELLGEAVHCYGLRVDASRGKVFSLVDDFFVDFVEEKPAVLSLGYVDYLPYDLFGIYCSRGIVGGVQHDELRAGVLQC